MTASPSKARRRMCFLFIILFMAFGFLLAVPAPDADETLSKVGSHSEEVRVIIPGMLTAYLVSKQKKLSFPSSGKTG